MKFSIFAPLGLFKFSSKPPEAKVIFDASVSALGGSGAYGKIEKGTRLEASLYAKSIRKAVIRLLLRRAGEADLPSRVHPELFPIREAEHGIVPPAGADYASRRRALIEAAKIPSGGHRFEIETALRSLLGSGFVFYRTIKNSERVLYPAWMGDSPMNLKLPGVPRTLIKVTHTRGTNGLLPGISTINTSIEVLYTPVIPVSSEVPLFQGGEQLVVEPEISARCERVTVTDGGVDSTYGPWLRAVFTHAHEPNAHATTSPFPFWVSNQRYALIVVKPEVASNPVLVSRIHALMRKLARAVSTWAVVESTGLNTAGPFKIGESPLGYTPLGTITFPAPAP